MWSRATVILASFFGVGVGGGVFFVKAKIYFCTSVAGISDRPLSVIYVYELNIVLSI